ncbi:hypothetical protein B0G83_102532 [Paraburkholderia sp. BL21I4N1]|nr:hypothetical protein B0G83_102532 [Paraburkholderia sp. BL21I4N1]
MVAERHRRVDMGRQRDRYPSPVRGREPGGVAPSAQVPRSERTSPARAAVPVMLDQDRSCVRGVPSFLPWRSTDRARRVEQRPPGPSPSPPIPGTTPRANRTSDPPPDGRPSHGPSRRVPVSVQTHPTDPGFIFSQRSEPSAARAASANVRPTARPARPERSSRCRPANPVDCRGVPGHVRRTCANPRRC